MNDLKLYNKGNVRLFAHKMEVQKNEKSYGLYYIIDFISFYFF